jgi:hypothetical protein
MTTIHIQVGFLPMYNVSTHTSSHTAFQRIFRIFRLTNGLTTVVVIMVGIANLGRHRQAGMDRTTIHIQVGFQSLYDVSTHTPSSSQDSELLVAATE